MVNTDEMCPKPEDSERRKELEACGCFAEMWLGGDLSACSAIQSVSLLNSSSGWPLLGFAISGAAASASTV